MDEEISYAELHAHSSYSFLDGVSDPEEMVNEAYRLGISGIAITDHNGFYALPKFASAAKQLGLATIFGAELTLESIDKRTVLADPSGDHLIVLAKSPKGYANLSASITHGQLAGKEKGRFSLSLLELAERSKGEFIVLTGCRKGAVPKALVQEGPQAAKLELHRLIELFGRDNVYVECWDHGEPIDQQRNSEMVELALSLRTTPLATSNAHYDSPKSGKCAHVVSAIRSRKSLRDADAWLAPSFARHLRSPKEQYQRFARFPGLVEMTLEVQSRCAFDLALLAPKLPTSLAPAGYSDDEWLRHLSYLLGQSRYGTKENERIQGAYQQIDYELRIISELGFSGYFLVVWDIVEFCRHEGIYCQGRGSAANSAVCYAIGITNVDPVSLRLLFERFLSPERDGPPDIDIDIESDRREEVLQYVFAKYGRDMAAQVANVITYRSKSAIREVGKVLGYPNEVIDSWSKRIERWGSVEAATQVKDRFGNPYLSLPDDVKQIAMEIENNPRHLGLHVGGMVICDRPIHEVCPIEWARAKDRSVLQWDKDDCATIGLVKFDLLGLGMLSALHEMVDIVAENHGTKIDLALIPQEDDVYEMLCRADSIGVFQVESRAQMATLPRLKPRRFYDLVVEVALIRPGPIQGGSVHPYIRRRNGEEKVSYLHPLLENSLSKTLGVPLFQEQLMQMAMDVAGFTPAEADRLRQAMGSKRSAEKMTLLKGRFFAGMAKNGIYSGVAESIFEKLSAFANFGFPESHAASFAYLVYASAWFKLHYPAAFLAGLLRSQPMGFWSTQTLSQDARRHGVSVLGPVVGKSGYWATLENGDSNGPVKTLDSPNIYPSNPREGLWPSVRVGLDSISGIGRTIAKKIVENGPYASMVDLATKASLNRGQMESLAQAGALLEIEELSLHKKLSRKEALWMAAPSVGIKNNVLPGMKDPPLPPKLTELTAIQEMSLDASFVGITTSGHPMELLRSELEKRSVIRACDLGKLQNGSRVLVAGVVTHRQRPATANGVTFINLEDETGLVNVICSKGVWIRFREVAKSNPALSIAGSLEVNGAVINIVATRIATLELLITSSSRDFH